MNKEFIVEAIKSNWYLAVAVVALPSVGVFMALQPKPVEDDPDATVVTTAAESMSDEEIQAARSAQQDSPWARAARPDASAEDQIADYKDQIANARPGQDTAGETARMANLYYSKMADWEQAALYYEILLREYPDYSANKVSYVNLASCYERLKEYDLARVTYERMREHFGPGTKEYEFATYQLENPESKLGTGRH